MFANSLPSIFFFHFIIFIFFSIVDVAVIDFLLPCHYPNCVGIATKIILLMASSVVYIRKRHAVESHFYSFSF